MGSGGGGAKTWFRIMKNFLGNFCIFRWTESSKIVVKERIVGREMCKGNTFNFNLMKETRPDSDKESSEKDRLANHQMKEKGLYKGVIQLVFKPS